MNLTIYIEYLLISHDCVVIPGVGAVLAHGLPAYYDKTVDCWFPPVKVLSFNPNLTRTDGLIASAVARREKISMDAAAAKVKTAAEGMMRCLEKEGRLQIGELGIINLDREGTMSFTPGTVSWISPSTMWLPMVSANEIITEEEPVEIRLEAIKRRKNRLAMFRRVAGVAACLAVVFLLGWIAVNNIAPQWTQQTASIIPVKQSSAIDSQAHISSAVKQIDNAITAAEEQPNLMPETEIPSSTTAEVKQTEPKYHLIVASVSSEKDAYDFIAQNESLNLGLLTKDGRYRIYAASGDIWEEVAAAANRPEIAERFPVSWVR